jgi:hypothetical protein
MGGVGADPLGTLTAIGTSRSGVMGEDGAVTVGGPATGSPPGPGPVGLTDRGCKLSRGAPAPGGEAIKDDPTVRGAMPDGPGLPGVVVGEPRAASWPPMAPAATGCFGDATPIWFGSGMNRLCSGPRELLDGPGPANGAGEGGEARGDTSIGFSSLGFGPGKGSPTFATGKGFPGRASG